MKKHARNILYDKLHKGAVVCCMGLTAYGFLLLANHGYRYFTQVRPKIQAAKEAAERELLSEGSSDKIM